MGKIIYTDRNKELFRLKNLNYSFQQQQQPIRKHCSIFFF